MKKLFWEDPYMTECTAKITEINGNKVKLNQTVFFAFSGGQASDEGTIGGIKVIEAVKQGDKENIIDIEYELEKAPDFNIGDEVEVNIDKEKREKLSKLHTATHIAFMFLIEKFGRMKVIGSNINDIKGRADFLSETPLNELEDVQKKTNAFLAQNHEVKRWSDEKNPDLQWWQCGEFKMPCGGTHVRNTSEIGKIRLRRVGKGKGKERVEVYLD